MSHNPQHRRPPAGPQQPDYSQPVAYDQQGNPLYAHPPQYAQPAPNIVHVARPMNPEEQPVPPEIMARYEASRKKYPHLNLSRGEFVISAVKRHWIGLVQIWLVIAFLMLAFGALFGFLFFGESAGSTIAALGGNEQLPAASVLLLGALFVLIVLGGFVATYIYNSNRFYLTNESVIQEIQTTLFARHEQTVSLSNIEDASYKQNGILPHLLNYGTIRLSTEGDETTYSFPYVMGPKRHIAVLNNAVEAFKNGRPVDIPSQDQPS
jgi:uncharacterized membrane protein YdbT with pleckstrin-like domain